MVWSLEDYCASQQSIDWGSLEATTRSFFETLDLPSVHPFCGENAPSFPMEGVPPMGPLEYRFENEGILDMIVTLWLMVAPPLLAMAELWLRLFAGLLGPLGILYLLFDEFKGYQSDLKPHSRLDSVVCALSVSSCLVLMTDTLYVLENGPTFGLILFLLSVILALRKCLRHNMKRTALLISGLVVLSSHLVWDGKSISFGDRVDEVLIDEGLYYDNQNDHVSSIVKNWPEHFRTYNKQNGATPWMPTGDSRTGLPFILNHLPSPEWKRVFLETPDEEYLALDFSFPEGGHSFTRPVYFILHGLNGGSKEEYIRDLTFRRNAEGSTVVVMIARGLMDTPLRGWNNFHGARTSDAHISALAIRRTLGPEQILIGAGYSMGAIILNNYAATYGSDCALDGAISLSGGLDMRYQGDFFRAQRLWQPMLTEEARDGFLLGKWGLRMKERLSEEDFLRTIRATHITTMDRYGIVPFHGFDDLDHYYREMSALGDFKHGSDGLMAENRTGLIHTVSIPLCVVQAFDDPLITWRATSSNAGFMHPDNLAKSGNGNTMLLLTKAGGHVGWPLGSLPFLEKWRWMSDVVMSFAEAVDKSKKANQ